jgi:hypothetical protein
MYMQEYIYVSLGTASGNTLNLQYEYDVQKPFGFGFFAINLNGVVSSDGNTYSGSIAAIGCRGFTLQR